MNSTSRVGIAYTSDAGIAFTNSEVFATKSACYLRGEFREPIINGNYSFNTGIIKKLSPLDYSVFFTVVSCTFCIGAYQAWKNRQYETLNEFLLAERLMSGVPVGLSLAATYIAGTTIMAIFNEVYMNGVMYLWSTVGFFLSCMFSAHVIQPIFYNLGLVTCYQYLELRFSRVVRSLAAALHFCSLLGYNCAVFYLPALAVKDVTGLPLWDSIIFMACVCVAITAFGGLSTIIVLDLYQLAIVCVSMLAVLGRSAYRSGSWKAVWESNIRSNRLVWNEVRLDPNIRHSVWCVLVGSFFVAFSIGPVSQQWVQKTFCCVTLRDVKIVQYIGFLFYILAVFMIGLLAIFAGSLYENCDPLHGELVEYGREILPLFVLDISDYGISGLFAAGVLVASLSTNNACFNAVSSIVVEDFIFNYSSPNTSDRRNKYLAQMVVCMYGILVVLGTLLVSKLDNVLQMVILVHGLFGSSVFGVFALGMFFPWANTKGAISGLFGSEVLIVAIFMITGRAGSADIMPMRCVSNCKLDAVLNFTIPEPVESTKFPISYMWYSVMNTMFTLIIGLLVSFATGKQNPSTLDPDLYVLFFDEVFPFFLLPESLRKCLRPNAQRRYSSQEDSLPEIALGTFGSTPNVVEQQKRNSSQEGSLSEIALGTFASTPNVVEQSETDINNSPSIECTFGPSSGVD